MQIYFPERPSPEADRRLAYTEYLLLRVLLLLFVGIIVYKVWSVYTKTKTKPPKKYDVPGTIR